MTTSTISTTYSTTFSTHIAYPDVAQAYNPDAEINAMGLTRNKTNVLVHNNRAVIGNASLYRHAKKNVPAMLAHPLIYCNIKDVVITPDLFVAPRLTEQGTVMSKQHYKTGMLVSVKTGDYNHYRKTCHNRDFIGMVVNREAGATFVRPLAGASTVGKMQFGIYDTVDANSAISKAHMGFSVPNGSVSLIDPASLTPEWYAAANKFISNANKLNRDMVKTVLFEKLSRSFRDAVAGFRKTRYVERGYREANYYQKSMEDDRRVKNYIKTLRAAITAGPLEMMSISLSINGNVRRAIEAVNKATPGLDLAERSCGHLSVAGVSVHSYRGNVTTVCKGCADNPHLYHDVLDAEGTTVRANLEVSTFLWADGTNRITREPEIIGDYHSSKRRMKKLPRLDGAEFTGLTMGFELEVERNPRSTDDRQKMARLLNTAIKASKPAAWPATQDYAFFERDGSVSDGFEMVTSYGDLAVHRHMVYSVFGTKDGKLPFASKLRSHDATSSCGLHVHVAKPKSLSHAAKLQAFWHDEKNRRLIRCVARRYDGSYAAVDKNRNLGGAMKLVKRQINRQGYTKDLKSSGWNEHHMQDAISQLNTERHEIVNFRNKETVEIRAFKGTMLPTTIMACLELTQASWYFCRDNKTEDLTTDNFLAWISDVHHRGDTGALRAYLALKGFNVFQGRSHPDAAPVMNEANCDEA